MSSYEDLLFQFDTSSTNNVDPIQQMNVDLENQLTHDSRIPRNFDEEALYFDHSEDDEATVYSRSAATTLLGQTPLSTAPSERNRDYRTAVGPSDAFSATATSMNVRNASFEKISSRRKSDVEAIEKATRQKKTTRERFSLPNIFQNIRRVNTTKYHPKISLASDPSRCSLNEAMVFSNYNNYLNDCIFHEKSDRTMEESRRQRLEQLADIFWLRDGTIEEDIFDESSDEEPVI